MERFLNVGLLRNPLNWLTIFLMVLIGLFAVNSVNTFIRAHDTDDK